MAAFSPELLLSKEMTGRLKAYTEFTLTRRSDLDVEFELIRQRGYAECVEEIERGMCSVAAPLGSSEFGKTLSVGATGSLRVFKPVFRAKIGQELVELGKALASGFDWGRDERARKTG